MPGLKSAAHSFALLWHRSDINNLPPGMKHLVDPAFARGALGDLLGERVDEKTLHDTVHDFLTELARECPPDLEHQMQSLAQEMHKLAGDAQACVAEIGVIAHNAAGPDRARSIELNLLQMAEVLARHFVVDPVGMAAADGPFSTVVRLAVDGLAGDLLYDAVVEHGEFDDIHARANGFESHPEHPEHVATVFGAMLARFGENAPRRSRLSPARARKSPRRAAQAPGQSTPPKPPRSGSPSRLGKSRSQSAPTMGPSTAPVDNESEALHEGIAGFFGRMLSGALPAACVALGALRVKLGTQAGRKLGAAITLATLMAIALFVVWTVVESSTLADADAAERPRTSLVGDRYTTPDVRIAMTELSQRDDRVSLALDRVSNATLAAIDNTISTVFSASPLTALEPVAQVAADYTARHYLSLLTRSAMNWGRPGSTLRTRTDVLASLLSVVVHVLQTANLAAFGVRLTFHFVVAGINVIRHVLARTLGLDAATKKWLSTAVDTLARSWNEYMNPAFARQATDASASFYALVAETAKELHNILALAALVHDGVVYAPVAGLAIYAGELFVTNLVESHPDVPDRITERLALVPYRQSMTTLATLMSNVARYYLVSLSAVE